MDGKCHLTDTPYPAGVEDIAEHWRRSPHTNLNWSEENDRAQGMNPGEAGGYVVRAPRLSYPAYLKPTKPCPTDRPRAAYEKIASDLAHELQLPVPPVQLYERPDQPDGEEDRCCVSLIMYNEVHNLGQVNRLPNPLAAEIDQALTEGSGIAAFDAWIGNQDRSNRKNTLIGVDENEELHAVFIDHANAFNMRGAWEDGAWDDVSVSRMPGRLQDAIDWEATLGTVERIEALSAEVITEVVERIPADYMADSHRDVVCEGLLARRELVRPVMEAQV